MILTGIDIVENKRIKRMMRRSPHTIDEIFSAKEIAYCNSKKYPEQSLSARFAAKEAVIKAVDSEILAHKLSDIETINLSSGKPEMKIHCSRINEKIRQLLQKDQFNINLSLSHETNYSVAHVLIY